MSWTSWKKIKNGRELFPFHHIVHKKHYIFRFRGNQFHLVDKSIICEELSDCNVSCQFGFQIQAVALLRNQFNFTFTLFYYIKKFLRVINVINFNAFPSCRVNGMFLSTLLSLRAYSSNYARSLQYSACIIFVLVDGRKMYRIDRRATAQDSIDSIFSTAIRIYSPMEASVQPATK